MEKLTEYQLRDVLQSIERALECSVCLECIRDSVVLCRNGHGVCNLCAKKLKECPQCRTPFWDMTPTMLNSVVRLLPRACRYEAGGCEHVVLPARDTEHERLCGYRETTCRMTGCSWVGLVNDTLNHLQCDHRNISVCSPQNRVCPVNLGVRLQPGFRSHYPVFVFNLLVWARLEVSDTSDVHMMFHVIPNSVAPALLATVYFKRGAVEFTNTVRVMQRVASEEHETAERVTMSCSKAKLFISASGQLVHSLKIAKLN